MQDIGQTQKKATYLQLRKSSSMSGTTEIGLWYSCESTKTLIGYCNADWTRNSDDRKSTSRGCFFLENKLVSWFSKKHNCIFLSTAEAKYMGPRSSCSQLIWMKNMMKDYGVHHNDASLSMTLHYDSINAINISKNPVQHSRTKHIDICYHFIISLVEDRVIELKHISTKHQLVDIFTKGLDAFRFETLLSSLGVCVP